MSPTESIIRSHDCELRHHKLKTILLDDFKYVKRKLVTLLCNAIAIIFKLDETYTFCHEGTEKYMKSPSTQTKMVREAEQLCLLLWNPYKLYPQVGLKKTVSISLH